MDVKTLVIDNDCFSPELFAFLEILASLFVGNETLPLVSLFVKVKESEVFCS